MGGGSGFTSWNGLTVGNGVARGNITNSNGITLIKSNIQASGGGIALYGRGRTGANVTITIPNLVGTGTQNANNSNGIRLHGGNQIDTGTGTIYMYGYADYNATGSANGVELSQTGEPDLITNANTCTQAIVVEGITENNPNASNAWGFYTHYSVVQNTSNGTIHIKGKGVS